MFLFIWLENNSKSSQNNKYYVPVFADIFPFPGRIKYDCNITHIFKHTVGIRERERERAVSYTHLDVYKRQT